MREQGIRRGSAWGALALATVVSALLAAPGARAASPCGDVSTRPWCDASLSPDARAQLLLDAMTPSDRVDLLGGDSLTGVAGGANAHTGVQDGVPSLGIPTINYTDGPLGPRQGDIVGLPSPEADAATWSATDARSYGQIVGQEAKVKGNDVVFGPTVNLIRTPLWGRTYEAFGEDPFLDAGTSVAWIEGVQSQGVMADVKHFAENNQEGSDPSYANTITPSNPLTGAVSDPTVQGGRMNVNVNVDERTLREMELWPFEASVKQADVATIMCSYPLVNGTHACENGHLLKTVLGQWGFKGYVISDYGAAHDTAQSLANGLDFEPWPGADVYGPVLIENAIASGQATMSEVDGHVLRMLRTWFASGVFDRAPFTQLPDADIPLTTDDQAAERIEENAITLLKNQGSILPLDAAKVKSIAVIGAGGTTFVTGGGSGNITPFHFSDPVDAIRARVASGTNVIVNDGSKQADAVSAARSAQYAVVIVPDYSSEGIDRACLTFECPPVFGNEDALIQAVAAANPNTIVVMENAGAILTPWRGQVKGLLEAWYPGEMAGPAIAHVLFGDVDPGGRLPITFPDSMAQEPAGQSALTYPGVDNQVHYNEGVELGYRWFDAHHETPAFPFGFGLSYTSFRLSRQTVGRETRSGVLVTARVTNTGRRTGSTVVELYAGLPPQPGVPQPPYDLRGYKKVTLGPRHSATVHLTLNYQDLAYWNTPQDDWTVPPGKYRIYLGFSSQNPGLAGTIRQTKTFTLEP